MSERNSGKTTCTFECNICGRYIISELLILMLQAPDDDEAKLLPHLRAHTRQATEGGQLAELTKDNWRDLARGHANTPVPTKLRKLLEFAAKQSGFPGDEVEVTPYSVYPLVDAVSADEVEYLLDHLVKRRLLANGSIDGYVVLTVEGWVFLEPTPGGIPGRAFVAMSFDPSLNDVYTQGIEPAIKTDCGFDPIRVDFVHHNGKICDRIVAEIRLAQFVVADVTRHRAGVYFEAGFAMGLGRAVIWTCQTDDLRNAHFDTRQYNHIAWDTPNDLRSKLTDRIRATIVK